MVGALLVLVVGGLVGGVWGEVRGGEGAAECLFILRLF